jgi:hypothetical protein
MWVNAHKSAFGVGRVPGLNFMGSSFRSSCPK